MMKSWEERDLTAKDRENLERGMKMVFNAEGYHPIWDYSEEAMGGIPVAFCKDSKKDWYFVMEHGIVKDGMAFDDILEAREFLNKTIKEHTNKNKGGE